MAQIPKYANEQDVYDATGFTSAMIQRVTEKESSEVTDLVNGMLLSAESKVKELLHIPYVKHMERHLGTGEDDEFDLGPEDEEFYVDYDPSDRVEKVFACYFGDYRKKKPLPKDCDTYSDDKSLWDTSSGSRVAPSNEATIKKAGDYSMSFVLTANQYGRHPRVSTGYYIDRNIDIFDFICLRVRSNTANVKITIKLYDSEDNYNYAEYTIKKANHWYTVMLHLDDDFTDTVDWDDNNLYYFDIQVDKACTLYVDNINFNDEWFFTAPSGKLVIARKSTNEPPSLNYPFYVTYTYDPFEIDVPECLKEAVAQFAGAKLIDHLIGIRQQTTGFEYESDTLLPIPDRETLYKRRGSLIALAKENLASIGYGFTFVPAE